MSKVKVSVILPSLNVVRYIREAVESVINQTLKDIEIICVDAGSTDGTLEILREYAARDNRVKLIISDKKSYGYQMNIGIDEAGGEYIGVVETDDYVPLYMYEELYELAKNNDVDLIKGDFYRFIGEGNKIIKAYYKLTEDTDLYNRIIDTTEKLEVFCFPIYTWAGIYKRSFLNENNIRHNESPGASYQDNGFWFQTLMYAKRAYFVNKPYYMNRRDNPNSSFFSKAKVYCMCDEYDFIYNILSRNKADYHRFKFVYSRACYLNYKFTLNRIADEYVMEFLERFQQDFIRMRDRGELDRALIGASDWEKLTCIMDDPAEYYRKDIVLRSEVYSQICKQEQVIIYGAGMVGRKLLDDIIFRQKPDNIIGFAVTDKTDNVDEYRGIHIYKIDELKQYAKTAFVVIATIKKHQAAITDILDKHGFENIIRIPEFDMSDKDYNIFTKEQFSLELKQWYRRTTGSELNLDKPSTFNEKIQWMKLYASSDIKAALLDKAAVRKWIEEKIGEEYLVPILGVYDNFKDIDFDSLPEKFVIKATHGVGYNVFVKDKNDKAFNKAILNRRFNDWLSSNYTYYNGFDLNYKNIKPQIIIESLVDGQIRHSNYKVLCFNGEPEYIIVDTNKDKYGRRSRDIFDVYWNHQKFTIKYPQAQEVPKMPSKLSEMLNLTRKLACDFNFIRVDWFITGDRILFNQVKFAPGNGVEFFSDPAYAVKLGDLIKL